MKRLIPFMFFALMSTCGTAYAVGVTQGVTVVNVDARSDGSFLVSFSQGITTPPPCAAELNRMTGNASTPGGKAVLAVAMLAYSTGSTVFAQGTGACTEYSSIESLAILVLRR